MITSWAAELFIGQHALLPIGVEKISHIGREFLLYDFYTPKQRILPSTAILIDTIIKGKVS